MGAARLKWLVQLTVVISAVFGSGNGDFNKEVDITWGDGRATVLNNGRTLALSLDEYSGSGFQSRKEFMYGRIGMKMKLVPGDSAGTVTTYYLSSQGPSHDEIDFEFLGNSSGQPYIVHTNIFVQGQGNREQQFYLWFDPTKKLHSYSILWNPLAIVFYVDNTPIRVFKNMEATKGIPFPKSQAMKIYGSIWDAEDWATQGGRVKTNWTNATNFTAYFANFKSNDACIWNSSTLSSSCNVNDVVSSSSSHKYAWLSQGLEFTQQDKIKWVQQNYMVYDYCKDTNRFPQGLPPECNN